MPSVVIRVDPERRQWWKETLLELLPGFEVYLWDEDVFEKSEIDYAVVWMPPLGALASLPNLKATFSVGAGVTHILRDASYPLAVPIVRTVNEDLRKRMAEYVVLHVLRFHRKLPAIQEAQRKHEWVQHVEPLARDISVGILGLGNLGRAAAEVLLHLGYRVNGWSRRGRVVPGVSVFEGEEGLSRVLGSSQVVVCMLPGTPDTNDLLTASRLAEIPEGGYLINVGRGETIVDAALIDALNTGRLGGATLDVFRDEPLAKDSPYWSHPNVLVTSHTASAIEPATGGRTIASNILAFNNGEHVPDIVDMTQGY